MKDKSEETKWYHIVLGILLVMILIIPFSIVESIKERIARKKRKKAIGLQK